MNFVNAAEKTVSQQTGKLITLRFIVVLLSFCSVPVVQSHKCFIDVFEINSPFIVNVL